MTGGLWHGAAVVARHEFRVRLRTGRWRWLLAVWVAVIGGFTGLLHAALLHIGINGPIGIPLFGSLMLFVLGLVLIVSPALTAQTINGDRERGTLATLQVTRLSAAHIVVGKLLAGWGVGLAALALTVPFVGWAVAQGGVGVLRAIVVLVVVALLIGVVCAVSQALSALLARSITSALLSYVVMFALSVGTVVAFGLGVALTTETRPVESGMASYTTTVEHPERVWWLLAPNPFVVLADAAPQPPPTPRGRSGDDPLFAIGSSLRSMRQPPRHTFQSQQFERESAPVWPYGLAFNLALGAGSIWMSVRRLRTPAGSLPKGVRVA